MSNQDSNLELHTIRLHGPWVAQVLASFGDPISADDQQRRVKIPSDWNDWLGADFCGRVEYRRNFNRPTGLDPGQPVWIVLECVDSYGEVYLNDKNLGSLSLGESNLGESSPSDFLRVQVDQLLERSNVLRVEIEVNADSDRGDRVGLAGGLIGNVRIEIQQ